MREDGDRLGLPPFSESCPPTGMETTFPGRQAATETVLSSLGAGRRAGPLEVKQSLRAHRCADLTRAEAVGVQALHAVVLTQAKALRGK